MNRSHCSTRLFFYSIWLLLSIIQAAFTELFHDEAYYWKYAGELAWGYFDHPPMIALVVKLGYLVLNNELGVRLLIILLNTTTIYLIERIINPGDLRLYYVIIASIVLLHYGGVLAIPDNPLLFFTATFYYLYLRYTRDGKWYWMVLLGVNAAALMLSKYHGALVIIATILSNPQLLKKRMTWIAFMISLLLFTPHLLWQYRQGFPSVVYQLFSRSRVVFDITYLLEFIFTQPLIYGPLIGFLLLYYVFREKPDGYFEKALKYNAILVFGIFLIFTLKGKVEAHWTDIALIPLLYFGYRGIARSVKLKRFTLRSLPYSLALILTMRVFLMVDFLPSSWHVRTEFHGWDEWAETIRSTIPYPVVVFDNSYQNAAKFEFYSGLRTICLTNQRGRMNQYDLWKSEEQVQGEKVTFLPYINNRDIDLIETGQGIFPYVAFDDYQTFPGLTIQADKIKLSATPGEKIPLLLTFLKDEDYRGESIMREKQASLMVVIYDQQNRVSYYDTGIPINDSIIDASGTVSLDFTAPEEGKYAVYFTVTKADFPPTVHSLAVRVRVMQP